MSRYNVNPITTSPLSHRSHPSSLVSPPPGPLFLTAAALSQPKVAIFVKKNGHVTLIHADLPEKQDRDPNHQQKEIQGEGVGEGDQVETLVHAIKPLYIRRQDYSRSEASFIGLPIELSVQILLYCRPRDVCTVAQTSHGMKLVASNESLWQQVCLRRRWTPTIPDLSPPSAWHRYTLRRHACARRARSIWPLLASYLGPSAMLMASHVTDEQIKQAQITCQWKQFSEEFLASIRMVDGQDETLPVGRGAVYGCRILSLREVVHEKRVYFPDQEWLPVTSLSGHQRVCLNDLGLVYLLSGLVPHYVAADWLTFLELLRHRA